MASSFAQKLASYAKNYTLVTVCYGFTRAVSYDYEGRGDYFNYKSWKHEKRPLLFVDNMAKIIGKTMGAVFLWPIFLKWDLLRLECFLRDKDFSDYKVLDDNTIVTWDESSS